MWRSSKKQHSAPQVPLHWLHAGRSFVTPSNKTNALNTHAVIQALPFGGVGHSGFGAYHGIDGFRNFSHKKSVFVAKRGFFLPNLLPPFSNFDLKIVEAALKEPPKFKKIAYAALACFHLYIAHRNGAPAAVYSALVKCIKYSCSILFRLPKA